MGPDNLLIIAIVVFCLLLIGLGLTVYEFHYYILNDEDPNFTGKNNNNQNDLGDTN